jgi:hypothetical protein
MTGGMGMMRTELMKIIPEIVAVSLTYRAAVAVAAAVVVMPEVTLAETRAVIQVAIQVAIVVIMEARNDKITSGAERVETIRVGKAKRFLHERSRHD